MECGKNFLISGFFNSVYVNGLCYIVYKCGNLVYDKYDDDGDEYYCYVIFMWLFDVYVFLLNLWLLDS